MDETQPYCWDIMLPRATSPDFSDLRFEVLGYRGDITEGPDEPHALLAALPVGTELTMRLVAKKPRAQWAD